MCAITDYTPVTVRFPYHLLFGLHKFRYHAIHFTSRCSSDGLYLGRNRSLLYLAESSMCDHHRAYNRPARRNHSTIHAPLVLGMGYDCCIVVGM